MDDKAAILDIAMNLNRIGNWAADGFEAKRKRIKFFLDATTLAINSLNPATFSPIFAKTFKRFTAQYFELEKEGKKGPKETLWWAELMMTWGNILTHRCKLL